MEVTCKVEPEEPIYEYDDLAQSGVCDPDMVCKVETADQLGVSGLDMICNVESAVIFKVEPLDMKREFEPGHLTSEETEVFTSTDDFSTLKCENPEPSEINDLPPSPGYRDPCFSFEDYQKLIFNFVNSLPVEQLADDPKLSRKTSVVLQRLDLSQYTWGASRGRRRCGRDAASRARHGAKSGGGGDPLSSADSSVFLRRKTLRETRQRVVQVSDADWYDEHDLDELKPKLRKSRVVHLQIPDTDSDTGSDTESDTDSDSDLEMDSSKKKSRALCSDWKPPVKSKETKASAAVIGARAFRLMCATANCHFKTSDLQQFKVHLHEHPEMFILGQSHGKMAWICTKCFKIYHLRVNFFSHPCSKMDVVEGARERRHNCKLCPERFPTLRDISAHLVNVHDFNGPSLYYCKCSDCPYVAKYPGTLTQHKSRCPGIKRAVTHVPPQAATLQMRAVDSESLADASETAAEGETIETRHDSDTSDEETHRRETTGSESGEAHRRETTGSESGEAHRRETTGSESGEAHRRKTLVCESEETHQGETLVCEPEFDQAESSDSIGGDMLWFDQFLNAQQIHGDNNPIPECLTSG